MFTRWSTFVALAALTGACGGTPQNTTAPTAAPAPSQSAPPAPPSASAAAPEEKPEEADDLELSGKSRIEDERNTIAVFQKCAAATVFVGQSRVIFNPATMTRHEIPAGSGSGFVWDTNGHVVTNYHVIKGARRVVVRLMGGKQYLARIVGVEPRKDIAVLKIETGSFTPTPIELPKKDDEVIVGQKTVAIGNPFGLDHTLTTGVVSALGREVDGVGGVTIRDMVQTDAAINPGNSGGPLLDSQGRLIGMNTTILTKSGTSSGIGFAVPVSAIQRIVPQLIEHGRVVEVGIGVLYDPRQRLERAFRIRGLVVLIVPPGSPAAAAGVMGVQRTADGLELGDVIVGINGEKVRSYDDFYNALDGKQPGDEVSVTLERGRARRTIRMDVIVEN